MVPADFLSGLEQRHPRGSDSRGVDVRDEEQLEVETTALENDKSQWLQVGAVSFYPATRPGSCNGKPWPKRSQGFLGAGCKARKAAEEGQLRVKGARGKKVPRARMGSAICLLDSRLDTGGEILRTSRDRLETGGAPKCSKHVETCRATRGQTFIHT